MGKVEKVRSNIKKKVQHTDDFSLRINEIKKSGKDAKTIRENLRKEYSSEAIRYYDNAKEILLKGNIKHNGFYADSKYIKIACGTAYSGVLVALDGYFDLKGIEIQQEERRDISFYKFHAGKLNRDLLDIFNSTYEILHLWGYYDGTTNSKVIKMGFEYVKTIIGYLKKS